MAYKEGLEGREGRDISSLFTRRKMSRRACRILTTNGYDTVHELPGGVKFRFIDAGHILGSATLELWFSDNGKEKKIVFSGDIGKNGNPIIRDPQHVTEADYVVANPRTATGFTRTWKQASMNWRR